jgi:phenylacetate-CoA ligase
VRLKTQQEERNSEKSTMSTPETLSYWDPHWETAPPDELASAIEERLRDQLRYVNDRSPFYRQKFDEAGIDPGRIGLDDLAELPFTTKDEVRHSQEQDPPLGAHACVGWPEISRIHASSGTTGQPTLIGLTRRDREMWSELIARCMWSMGARPESRAWVAATLGWWIAGVTFVDSLQHLGAAVLPAGHTEPGRTFSVLQRTGVDFVISTPSFVKYLAKFAREEMELDVATLGIRHMALGGEPGAGLPHTRSQLEEQWDCKVYDCMGTADFATLIWSECEAQEGMHFQGQGFIIPKFIDPNNGEQVAPEQGVTGELVYTAIWRECTPLIRFRIGDLAEVLGHGRCSCGRSSFRIRAVGRTDDMLISQGVNIYPSAVADVVAGMRPQTTGQVQIQVEDEGPSIEGPVPLTVEFDEASDLSALKTELEDKIRNELLFRAEVELVPRGTLAPESGMKSSLVHRPGG